MATSYNTTVKLYKGVPLVKGGTEVLYLSGAAAEGVLSAFLVGTYSAYYFERENRRYIQIDDLFGSLDDVNYLSFANMSHGGKIYCGFVDSVIYINDHNTQLQFTIDPFATFIGDTTRLDEFFLIRNTPRNDLRGRYLEPDYLPQGAKTQYQVVGSEVEYSYSNAAVMFAAKNAGSYGFAGLTYNGVPLGLELGALSDSLIQNILDNGGVIVGAYLLPDCWNPYAGEIIQGLGTIITGDPLAHLSGYTYKKISTGVYTKIVLQTSGGVKTYDLEDFANVNSISFKAMVCFAPAPTICVYPVNYRGIADNIGEGITIQAPSIPISGAAGYTDRQISSDIFATLTAAISGAVSGAAIGGAYGAAAGGIAGALGGVANMAKNNYMSQFTVPQTFMSGGGLISSDKKIKISLTAATPSQLDLNRIDAYFDFYGYNMNHVITKTMAQFGQLNVSDGAFLQTGSPFVAGSEADNELNARIMSGIKIRQTLS